MTICVEQDRHPRTMWAFKGQIQSLWRKHAVVTITWQMSHPSKWLAVEWWLGQDVNTLQLLFVVSGAKMGLLAKGSQIDALSKVPTASSLEANRNSSPHLQSKTILSHISRNHRYRNTCSMLLVFPACIGCCVFVVVVFSIIVRCMFPFWV